MDIADIYADNLYTSPSFFEGMARVMDFSGALSHYDIADLEAIFSDSGLTGAEADAAAIRECWEAVGMDIYHAIGRFEQDADALGLAD